MTALTWHQLDRPHHGAHVTATVSTQDRPHGLSLALKAISLAFGQRRVLHTLNLQVAAGQFVAVVGRSGCGKSTLLRLLAGLVQPSSGQVTLDGQPVQAADGSPDHPVRLMFQEARLLPWKSVIANVMLGLQGIDARARALQALQSVDLADRADEWPTVLSGGQRQRVALARALVHVPRVLLLDEPLGALDALTRREMQALVGDLCRARGLTVVLVTHDIAEAVALADRVILLEHGAVAVDVDVAEHLPGRREDHPLVLAALEHQLLQRVLSGAPASAEAPTAT